MKQNKLVSAPPGTLVHVGTKHSERIKTSAINYSETSFEELFYDNVEDCFKHKEDALSTWINIDGLHDIDTIEKVGNHFDLHPLLLEDVLNTHQRPKFEEFENYVFISLKMIGINKKGNGIISEQVSFVLGKNWVISFQEQEGDIFELIRDRLRENRGVIRKRRCDYLFYRFIDIVVDHYFLVVDHISDNILTLEEVTLDNPDKDHIHKIQSLKKQLVSLRKMVSPLRDAVGKIPRGSNTLISEEIDPFFRDVYDHLVQVNEAIETQRDLLSGVMDLYLSGISNNMNQIMKILTIISTIFIPLTFMAGIYGMNFDVMPELHWEYSYLVLWGLMIVVTIIMVRYFRKKKWL